MEDVKINIEKIAKENEVAICGVANGNDAHLVMKGDFGELMILIVQMMVRIHKNTDVPVELMIEMLMWAIRKELKEEV